MPLYLSDNEGSTNDMAPTWAAPTKIQASGVGLGCTRTQMTYGSKYIVNIDLSQE